MSFVGRGASFLSLLFAHRRYGVELEGLRLAEELRIRAPKSNPPESPGRGRGGEAGVEAG